MHFGILAAGEGSRLVSEGVAAPKPLVKINGEPMIERLIRIFERCGAESVNVVINEEMSEVREFLKNLRMTHGVELNVTIKSTPSSMHTFYELSRMLDGKGRFVATTVDTIFREADFRRYIDAFNGYDSSVDGVMAVTDYVDDEKPLWVATDADMNILAFRDTEAGDTKYISGGIYGLDQRAVDLIARCIGSGMSRMRNFQRALVDAGIPLKAFPMGKVLDVDHAGDIEKAEAFIATV